MKTNKLIAAGALALSMAMTPVASLINAMPIAAAGTIKVPTASEGETQRTYVYYQIFTGEYSKDGEADTLVNLKWGEDGNGAVGTAVSKAAVDELLALNDNKTDRAVVDKVLTSYLKQGATGTPITGNSVSVPDGYYLIKETTNWPEGTQEATGLDVVQIIGSEYTIQPKTSTPSFEKKTKDVNDSKANSTTDWQDSGDYDFEDVVPFQLKATLGEKYDTYKNYQIVFNDTYDTQAFNKPENIVVKAGDKTLTLGTDYSVTNDGNGSLTVVVKNLKTSAPDLTAGSTITVEYTAVLKDTATLGAAIGENNRNQAYIEFTNNPNWDGEGESPKGETPKDQVRVFTYKLDVNKKAEDGTTALTGATFKLSKKNAAGTYVEVKTIEGTDKTQFTFSGLDDGDYKLEETTAPSGYNAISPIEFTITAKHDETSDDPQLTELDFGTLKATISEDKNGSVDITNTKNANLPETGGMGTTMIYGVGAVMVAGAAVFYVTNKRTRKD
ncbi:SpaA isopeptide-forming pilin-related protein [Faecalibaculum rodentium]|uniref:SpaA isopeptide-forming pilin-related protein n=1 Tax=Faecalibaculum rodentium TaxID=1702221 RepID=UPI0023EFDF34|nr:isopeptide-forming domain-containing fimbrial protein [Faecalibaculum rodentium]